MAEIFSTAGLLIDVFAVVALILLSNAESGMARMVGTKEGILQGLKLKGKHLTERDRSMLALLVACGVGVIVGTGLMIAGIWVGTGGRCT